MIPTLLVLVAMADETISLEAAMDRAATAAVAVQAAEAGVDRADAGVVQARSASLPSLSVQAGLQVWDRELTFSFSGDGDTSSLDCSAIPAPFDAMCASFGQPTTIREQVTGSVTVRAVQPLTGLAATIPALRAAGHAQEAAEAQVDAARVSARYQAADAWLAAMEADAQLEIATSQVTTLEARERAIAAAVDARAAIRNDLLQVQLALAQARQAVLAVTVMRDAARAALSVAIGGDGTPVLPDGVLPAAGGPVDEVEALVARALAGRDDLRALRAQREAAAQSALSTSLQRVPSLVLLGSYTHQEGQGLGAARDSGFGGLQLDWTVWAWDRQAAATRGARATVAQMDAQLGGLEAGVRAEIVARRSAVLSAASALEVAEATVGQAELNRTLFQARYEAGTATMLELLDAEAQVVRARSSAVASRAALVRAEAGLRSALGE